MENIKIYNVNNPGQFIVCSYNPESISISYSVDIKKKDDSDFFGQIEEIKPSRAEVKIDFIMDRFITQGLEAALQILKGWMTPFEATELERVTAWQAQITTRNIPTGNAYGDAELALATAKKQAGTNELWAVGEQYGTLQGVTKDKKLEKNTFDNKLPIDAYSKLATRDPLFDNRNYRAAFDYRKGTIGKKFENKPLLAIDNFPFLSRVNGETFYFFMKSCEINIVKASSDLKSIIRYKVSATLYEELTTDAKAKIGNAFGSGFYDDFRFDSKEEQIRSAYTKHKPREKGNYYTQGAPDAFGPDVTLQELETRFQLTQEQQSKYEQLNFYKQ